MRNTEELRKSLLDNGFVHVKGFMTDANLKLLDSAISEVTSNPSPFKIVKNNEQGCFFMDFNNWRRMPVVEELCKLPRLVDLVTKLTNSEKCWLMHEDVVVKSGCHGAPTPIHHDRPYFIFKGDLNLSVWMTAEDVARNSSLTCYRGTHLLNNLFLPKVFKTGSDASEYPELDKSEYEVIRDNTFAHNELVDFELKAGDVVVFFHKTIHGSHPHSSPVSRRSLVVRYLLDGASLTKKYFNNVPPYEKMGVNIKEDAPVPEEFFPLLTKD